MASKKHKKRANLIQNEVERYSNYLRDVRGLLESTISYHKKNLIEFLFSAFQNHEIRIDNLKPAYVQKYVEQLPSTKANGKKKTVCGVLSSYFRFLDIQGGNTQYLIAAIPSIPIRRRSIIPTIISKNDYDQFLGSFNRTTPMGKRSYAVIRCLSDLAMRIGDVSRISLDDFDWKQGTIRICNNKRATPFVMPLPKYTGEAIVDYIFNGRPSSESRFLFLSHARGSQGKPATCMALKTEIQRLWRKSGMINRYSGTHIFRRSTATSLKNHGMSLKIISDLLGHSSIESSALYAQVDTENLRSIAQPWPLSGET